MKSMQSAIYDAQDDDQAPETTIFVGGYMDGHDEVSNFKIVMEDTPGTAPADPGYMFVVYDEDDDGEFELLFSDTSIELCFAHIGREIKRIMETS